MIDRTSIPVNSGIVFDVNTLPERETLSNGVDMYVVNMPSTQLVQLCIMSRGGQWLQSKPLQAAMAYKLMKEGTRYYHSDMIDERLDYYGAVIGTSVNMSEGHIVVQCLKEFLPEVLPIVIDMLSTPTFDESKMSLALSQAKVSHEVAMQTVVENSKRLFYSNVFGPEHPMSRFPVSDDYDKLTRSDLLDYVNKNVSMSNCIVYLIGDVDTETRHLVSNAFLQFNSDGAKFEGFGHNISYIPAEKRYVKNMEEPTVQASVRVGCPMISRTHPDYIPLMVLNTLFGGYFGSRLMSNIRESKGYTYGISSSLIRTPHNTLLSIHTETANEFVDNVISEIYFEMSRLSSELVSESELRQVKNYVLGNMCRAYETNLNLYTRLISLTLNGMSMSDIVAEAKRIEKLTPSDMLEMSRRYLNPDKMIECIAM